MKEFAARQLAAFERGQISRRRLVETLTLAATASASAARAAAPPDPALKFSIVNHISYTCPDFRRAADWYARMFNLDQVGATERDVNLPFGKQGEKPFGITAADIPLTHLTIRTRPLDAPNNAGQARRQSRAKITHIGYTVAAFDRARARAELAAAGARDVREDGPYCLTMTDPFGLRVRVSGLENTAITDG
jgi:catechol 2,3-dioxygenase-like lactoylglutathione lyase family enzyme